MIHQTLTDPETAIRSALADGHCFQAHDLCVQALAEQPDNLHLRLLAALIALRAGDVSDAKAIVEPLALEFESTESRVLRLSTLLGIEALAASGAAQEVATLLSRLSVPALAVNAISLDLMSQICLEVWRRMRQPNDLKRATGLASRAFEMERTPQRAYAAAVLARLSGQPEEATSFAAYAVGSESPDQAEDPFAHYSRMGVLALLQSDQDASIYAFSSAGKIGKNQFALRVALRRELTEMADSGLQIPAQALAALTPPVVVLFSGPGVDLVSSGIRCFPAEMEGLVATKISEHLETLGAEISYSCADPGCNLMFIEAMLQRDAEVNIVLPCAVEDFIENRVRPSGSRWEKRFRSALKLAHSVTLTTTDPLLNDQTVLEHNSHIIDGTARLRARSLDCHPYLLAVWDFNLPPTPGSTTSFIDHWGDPSRLRMIDLDDCRNEAGITPFFTGLASAEVAISVGHQGHRTVCSMLFADVVGYSKLREVDLPAFWTYMTAVTARMQSLPTPLMVESWGDALYIVHKSSRDMARYATELSNAFAQLDSRSFGMPGVLKVRIGLHTGPIFFGTNPLTGRPTAYGGQVNRAARIEPIAKPGMIYASEQFVAALVSEESLYADEMGTGSAFLYEYLGTLELAKNYGQQAIYLLSAAPTSK